MIQRHKEKEGVHSVCLVQGVQRQKRAERKAPQHQYKEVDIFYHPVNTQKEIQ